MPLPRDCVSAGVVTITWGSGATSRSNDWVAFWQIGSSPPAPANMATWTYVSGGQTPSTAPSTVSGSVSITAPSAVGTYMVYYCLYPGYTCIASVQVNVVGEWSIGERFWYCTVICMKKGFEDMACNTSWGRIMKAILSSLLPLAILTLFRPAHHCRSVLPLHVRGQPVSHSRKHRDLQR